MNSNAIHDALANLLKSPITYVAEVGFRETKYFLCVGTHSFFLITNDLGALKGEIYYAHLQKLTLDTKDDKVLMLQLTENKDPGQPGKMIFACQNRKVLADHIKSAWKTDHMYRMGQVMDLPVFQGSVSSKMENSQIKKPKIPKVLLEPNTKWESRIIKDYRFFIPVEFNNQVNINTYSEKGDKGSIAKFFIQISDEISLDTLSFLDGRQEIALYCEEYANKLVQSDEDVWIISSKAFVKRQNLNLDIASYSGWEVHMRTKQQDIIVIMIRRKYIPPLLDSFVDFVVVFYGPEDKQKDKNNESNLSQTTESLKKARKVADSIHPTFVTNTIYIELIKKRANALYYDDSTLEFLKYRLPPTLAIKNILPKFQKCGMYYLKLIFDHMSPDDRNKYSDAMSRLKQLIQDEDRQFDDDQRDKSIETDELKMMTKPEEVRAYMASFLDDKKGDGNQNWKFKIARYLAYCIDGGLLSYKFTLIDLVELSHGGTVSEIDQEIYFLLHFKSKDEPLRETSNSNITNTISEFTTQNKQFVYNQKVMIGLLDEGYFKNKVVENERYSQFLMKMIDTASHPFVKTAICQQIIEDKKQNKQQETNFDDIVTLIKPLLFLYKSEDLKAAASAAKALTNLSAKNNEVKEFVMKEGSDLIMERLLKAKEPMSLKATLELQLYLMINFTQNIQLFYAKNGHERIKDLIKGSPIIGVWYPDDAVEVMIKILRELMINIEDAKKAIQGETLKAIVTTLTCNKSGYRTKELITEVLTLCIIKLQEKDLHSIDLLAIELLPKIMEFCENPVYQSSDMIDKFLTFFLAFRDSNDATKQLRERKILEHLQKLDKNSQTHYKKIENLKRMVEIK